MTEPKKVLPKDDDWLTAFTPEMPVDWLLLLALLLSRVPEVTVLAIVCPNRLDWLLRPPLRNGLFNVCSTEDAASIGKCPC